ncbi:MAG: TetR/AcrR family transcriptional regulator [Candidatus Aminicenantes bacterium]|nr:TetR/AcrR family transcriptional regulator [Candidatus Aminicenantes bacterium]
MKEKKDSIKSKKFQEITETAYDLFMRHGIKRITIEEICRTAGVSKMTFYKYFENKNSIAISILDNIFTKAEKQYQDIMAQEILYSEKVKDIIKLKMEASKDVSKEMLHDLWHNPVPEVADYMQKRTQATLKLFLEDMIAAQIKGEIRPNINPHFILYFIGVMQNMTNDDKLLSLYETSQDLASELVNFFFYGILTRENE